MKKSLCIVIVLLTVLSLIPTSLAETGTVQVPNAENLYAPPYLVTYNGKFPLWNGIQFGDTMSQVRSKEPRGIKSTGDRVLTANSGYINGIEVVVEYHFDANGKLEEVLWLPTGTGYSTVRNIFQLFTDSYGQSQEQLDDGYYATVGLALKHAYAVVAATPASENPYVAEVYEWIIKDSTGYCKVEFVYARNVNGSSYNCSVSFKHVDKLPTVLAPWSW